MPTEPVSEEWVETPYPGFAELGEITCPSCNGRGCVRVNGPEDYGCNFESEGCERCRGWGILREVEDAD